jgi:ribosomal protein S12 methylthiotransferase accessory factor
MREAFHSKVRFCSDFPPVSFDTRADLAIGVYQSGDIRSFRAFSEWASAAKLPALSVGIGADEAVIGPLALPDRAGCGHCAQERMAAATASYSSPADVPPSRLAGVAAATGAVLVREIRAIARQSAKCSQLVDHVLVVTSQDAGASWVTSLHRVIPLSRCPGCGGAALHPRKNIKPVSLSPGVSPATLLSALAGWVDPRTGVISRVVVEQAGDRGTDLPIVVTAAPPHVRDENGLLKRLPIGWGKGLTLSGALLSAIGEAIERYAASLPDPAQIVWERPNDLDGDILDPRNFPLYTDDQYERAAFPYVRFDPQVRHPWVQGRWLGSDAPVWVPALFAFLSLTVNPEHLICQGTSNGLAASTDWDEAALRATLELVERDAFMTAWFTSCAGRKVDLDSALDPLLRQVMDGIEGFGAIVELYLLPTSACGTTALCLALGDGEQYPGVTIGLGTDPDPRSAIKQAILELGQTGPHLRRLVRSRQIAVPAQPHLVREMLDHAAYYFPVERAAAFNWLRNRLAPITLRDLGQTAQQRSLANCAATLRAAGVRVALVDVSSPDVATGPLRVVRAISPDLQPISYGYGLDYQPGKRIRQLGLATHVPAIHPIW